MKRHLLAGVTALFGFAGLHGHAMASEAAFDFQMQRKTINGHAVAYIDEGKGDPVLFLHGNPTSSYLWRNIIPAITPTHRAIAADMIGMGQSDKPDIAYSYEDHASHLHGLFDSLDLDNVTLVLHDWGGALGFDWAMKNPRRVKAIAFMETIAPPVFPFESYEAMGELGELFKAWRTPGVGEQMVLEENMFINEMLGKIAVKTPLSEDVLAHYNSYFTSASDRAPLLAWPRQVPIGGEPAYTTALTQRIGDYLTANELPKLLFHVTPGAVTPPSAVAWLKENVPNLQTVHLGQGAHFIQEDYPEEIGSALATWLNAL